MVIEMRKKRIRLTFFLVYKQSV